MSDIFISYSSADRHKAKLLVDVLSAQGWAVWWDRVIPPGKTFDEVIEKALDSAKCIIVLWSKTSTSSNWVKAEAGEGLRREILVPVLLEDVRIPLEFRRIQAANLSGWQGESSNQEIDKFLVAIESLLGSPVGKERRNVSREFKVSGEHAEDSKRATDQHAVPKGPETFPSDKDRAPKKLSPFKGGLSPKTTQGPEAFPSDKDRAPKKLSPFMEGLSPKTTQGKKSGAPKKMSPIKGALLGTSVGFPVGILANTLLSKVTSDTLFSGILLSIVAAIVGAVCRNDRSLLSAAAIGAVMGGIIWAIFDSDIHYVAIRTVAFGGSAGAILCSLGALFWKK